MAYIGAPEQNKASKPGMSEGGIQNGAVLAATGASSSAGGFAGLNGGTTGGAGGRTVTVTTGAQLQAAINGVSSSSGPLTILVKGQITPANSGTDEIVIAGRNNISIVGNDADFAGIGIRMTKGSSNIIVQNLKIHDVMSGQKDAIGIDGPSRNIWIDHNELYSTLASDKDTFDGLLDTKNGAEYITVSNNYFHDHHKVSLNGFSDDDSGARNITFNNNYFSNVGSRVPSVRYGSAHIYNNYYDNISVSGINIRQNGQARIEGNVFDNSHNPIVSLDSEEIGYFDVRNNAFNNVTLSKADDDEVILGPDGRSTTTYTPPYAYSALPTGNVKNAIKAEAGVRTPGGWTEDTSVVAPPASSPMPTNAPAPPPVAEKPASAPTPGPNTSEGGAANVTIRGQDSADRLAGGDGNDTIDGAGGKDTLNGGAGDDVLIGGLGKDVLTGGLGADRFVFLRPDSASNPKNADAVTDFSQGQRDLIDLSGIAAEQLTFIGRNAFSNRGLEVRFATSEGTTTVMVSDAGSRSTNMTIVLSGNHTLGADDFLL